MKKIIILLICSLCLCSCSGIYSIDESKYEKVEECETKSDVNNKERIKLYEYVKDKLDYDKHSSNYPNGNVSDNYWNNKNKEEIEKIMDINVENILNDMEEINNIKITQENGRKVNIYKDKNYKDIILIYDKENISSLNGSTSWPIKYDDFVNYIYNNSSLILYYYKVGGKKDLLSFINTEFLFFKKDNHSLIFDKSYRDVKIEFENIPLNIMVYFKDNKIDKLHIVYIDVKYNNIILSNENINQIKDILEKNNAENIDEIINEFKNSIDSEKSNKGNNDGFSWESIKKLNYDNRYEYNDFIVTIK